MPNPHRLAAIDLGSNSFRLEIGQVEQGVFQRTEYLKETVRQGNGLDEDRNLTTQAMQRGWDCLARFGERLAGFKSNEVRAVATQTLREARNRDEFLRRGVAMLGFPIDVISGREEARLIYQGVSQALPPSDDRRLVVDIGVAACPAGWSHAGSVASPGQTATLRIKIFPKGLFSGLKSPPRPYSTK